jgi:hypothetical protein
MISIQIVQCVVFLAIALWHLQQGRLEWVIYHLLFAVGFGAAPIRAGWKAKCIELERQQIEGVMLLTRETGVAITEDEFYLVLKGSLSLEHLKQILEKRQMLLFSHIKTDCLFFSKSMLVKCAVNPSGSCEECRHFKGV